MATWSDDEKQKVIKAYVDANPTAENSVEIVKTIAADNDQTPNGVRMVLIKAEVYIKKSPTTSTSKDDSDKPVKVSKADSIEALGAAIEDLGEIADHSILGKLTGKAAQYFLGIISRNNK